jgi:hypothetical protein
MNNESDKVFIVSPTPQHLFLKEIPMIKKYSASALLFFVAVLCAVFGGILSSSAEDGKVAKQQGNLADKAKEPSKLDLPKALIDSTQPGWRAFEEKDFKNANLDDDTWKWGDVITCKGTPTGVIRSVKEYTNFEMVAEWRHMKPSGNSGIFVWAQGSSIEKLKNRGKPHLPDGIEIQILDQGYATNYIKNTGKKPWFTTHGDVFSTGTSSIKPFEPVASGSNATRRSFPRKELSKPSPEWNHYYIRAINGEVRLWVNGEEVSGGNNAKPATGYICLESEGSPTEFRNLRIRELP